jgi:hypothetical protein
MVKVAEEKYTTRWDVVRGIPTGRTGLTGGAEATY